MPEDALVDRAIDWLVAYGDADDLATARGTWDRFSSSAPTVTVFGAYDSGKSSLLRRLLVDADIPVPEWLTISARHETFEASGIAYRNVLLMDTPGVSPGSTDSRGERNTTTALEAIKTTDILVVVVTSQLLTGERELVAKVLDLPWREDALWFVISRFDEAGVDPDGDPDGYHQLADSKRRELAEELQGSLGRNLKPRVFVTAPDAYGVAGPDPSPDPRIWDPYRDWDGVAEIAEKLESLPSSADALRVAAAERFWIGKLRDQRTTLDAQETEVESVARTTTDLTARVDQLNSRLEELLGAARNDLNTAVGSVVDQAMASAILTEDALRARLTDALKLWQERQEAELATLVEDIEHQLEQQVARPSWQGLRRLIEQLAVHLPADDPTSNTEGVNIGNYKKPLLELNKDLAKTTTDLKTLFETKTKATKRAATEAAEAGAEKLSTSGKIFKGVDAGTKVVPIALDALELIRQISKDAKKAKAEVQRRTQLETQLETLKKRVVTENYEAFQSECDGVAGVLNEVKASINALATSLDARRISYQAARAEAADLF